MKDMGLVSIITPSYNTCEFIIETIKSVQAQTYPNWEMIVVDDCSTDITVEMVTKYLYASNEHRVKVLSNFRNSGAAISRNYALRVAKGRWIAFIDSDDLWMPDKLEKQISFMINNKYFFTYTNYYEIDINSNLSGRFVTGPKHITKSGMYNYCWPGCLTVMYDYSKIGLVQIENIKKNNDYAMWLQISKKEDCYLLNMALGKYRKRPGSISNQGLIKLVKWHYRLFKNIEGFSVFFSILYTIKNIFFGSLKKLIYVKNIKNEEREFYS